MNTQEMIETIRSNYPPENYSMLREALDRCLTLLEAEAEGRLLVLPCGVGDMAWFIAVGQVMYGRCRSISIHAGGIQINMDDTDGEPWSVSVKKVFSAREEAEAARKNGNKS